MVLEPVMAIAKIWINQPKHIFVRSIVFLCVDAVAFMCSIVFNYVQKTRETDAWRTAHPFQG